MVEKTMGVLEDRRYECSFFAVSSYAKPMETSRVLHRLHYRAPPPRQRTSSALPRRGTAEDK